jgi:hypothetical protein
MMEDMSASRADVLVGEYHSSRMICIGPPAHAAAHKSWCPAYENGDSSMTSKKKNAPTTATLRAGSSATKTTKPTVPACEPVQFRYLLAQWVTERRSDGWYIARSWASTSGQKPKWEGPFAFPQDAAIARYLCAELSNRHQSKARFYRVKPTDPIFGQPPLPDLSITSKRGGKS